MGDPDFRPLGAFSKGYNIQFRRRLDNILNLVSHVHRGKKLTIGLFLKLLGKLTAASTDMPLGLLSLCPLQVWVNGLGLDPKRHQGRMVMVSGKCLQSLKPWRNRVHLSRCVPLGFLPSRREVVVTDAAVWNHRTVRGTWGPQQRLQHINVLELRAVHLVLRHFLPFLKGRHVLVRSDNTSTVYHVNHQGGTRSSRSLWEAQRLLQ